MRFRLLALATLVGIMVVAPSAGATVTLPPGSLTIPSSNNGKFSGGSASVTVYANGCELSCHTASGTATVELNGSK
jgi:hypothetical protein